MEAYSRNGIGGVGGYFLIHYIDYSCYYKENANVDNIERQT